MGIILSRFRRKLTSLEELESIEEKIQDIEKYRLETEQRQKKVVGKLVVYSVGVYVLAAAVFYFLFFPASLRDRLFYIIPLLVFPIIVILVKKLISWYYVRQVSKQQDLLRRLRSSKRLLLEQVMEKETYKVARTILEKFAPDQLQNNNKTGANSNPNLRAIKPSPNSTSTAILPAQNNSVIPRQLTTSIPTPGSEVRLRTNVTSLTQQPLPPASSLHALQPVLPRPRPVLPKESGILDRLIESIVGDGPSWRYALVCSQCHGHNGMALREEFPFLAFHCCYCSFFNPAKKQRPLSPRLLDKEEERPETSSDSDPDSESPENKDTKTENKDCPNKSGVEIISPETIEENEDNNSPKEENEEITEPLKKDDLKVD
ncbi:zinc-ribbon metal-binding protein lunapark [Lycorma delicatula]|uniref:zinc-ribbon metal-binding protein lunapark n=1 Tax=Lycorma delicatula TaxID=130591 RepID=UPI003F511356